MLKSFSLLMTLVMLVVCIPAAGAQAIADEIAERKTLAEAEEIPLEESAGNGDSETTEYEIIEEVVEKRTENQKEFLLSDGSFLVAVYGNAVHYEEDGEWVDIDNTLVFEASEKQIEQESLEEAETTEEVETLQPESEIDIESETPNSESEMAAEHELGQSAAQGEAELTAVEPTRSTAKEEKLDTDVFVTSADEFSGYKNTANTFEVKFASDLSQGVLYNVTENKYRITMSLVEKPETSGNATLLGQSIEPPQANKEESVELEKATAGVEYGEVYDDVDIQYSLSGSSIKEDIIIKSPGAPSSYTFRFVVEGLNVEQIDDGYISFTDKVTGEELYYIPRPFAYDHYGQILFNSWQVLVDKGDSVYELTIAIGEEYMDEEVCAFPLIVDPILIKSASKVMGNMTYKMGGGNEGYPTDEWGGTSTQAMCAGNIAIAGTARRRVRSYFQWSLPTIEDGSTIVNATLNLRLAFTFNYDTTSSYNLNVNAYMMDRTWSGTSMNWNTQPLPHAFGANFIEEIITPLDSRSYTCTANSESNHETATQFDVTRAVQAWYQGTEVNNGIAFASDQESGYNTSGHKSYVVYWSPNVSTANASRHPYFVLNYRTAVGTESYWDTYAHTPGASMAGNVNLHNGSLSLTTSIFNDRVLRMPFSYSYTYNSIKTNNNYGAAPYAAKGWITNISQKITPVTDTAYTSLGYKYIYMDADGTEHWFYTYNNKIVDEDGLNLTILESNATYYILETKAKDRLYFRRSDGALSHYEGFNDENSTQLSYTSGPAVRITTPGNRVSEVYKSTTTNRISSFVDPMGYTSYFTVTSDRLTEITLGASKSGAVLNYEYHPVNGLLTRVTDSFGSKTEYTYNSRKQVIELKQFVMNTATSNYQMVNNVQFDYSATNQTVVRGWGADEVMGNSDDILTTYIFDGFGATINVHTTSADKATMYSASSYQYTDRKSDNPSANPEKSNRIEVAGYASGNAENLIANGNFEKMSGTALSTISGEMSGWNAAVWRSNGSTTDDFIVALDNSNSMFGAYSLKMQINEDVSYGNTLAAAYEINLEPGTYVLHGYVKNDLSDDFGGYVGLSANGSGVYNNQYHNQNLSYYGPKSGVNQVEHAEIMSHDENKILEGWIYQATRFHVSGTGLQSVSVGVVLANNNGPVVQGSVWLDGVKLERIGNAYSNNGGLERFSITTWSDFNLVSNGSFESNNASYIPTGWTVTGTGVQSVSGNYVGTTPVNALFGSYGIRMGMTNKYTTSSVSQMIPIDGNKGDVYVLGGWSKGMPLASGGDYGIKATVYYYNGTTTKTSSSIAHFNKYYTDWQHTSVPVVIEDMGAGYVARSVKVELLYTNMASYAVFDNIQLIKDAGYSYSYDSKGNLVSTTDYKDRKVGIIYDQVTNLPTTYVDAKGNEYTYEYDTDRNLVGTTTPLGIITSTDYNDFGQALSGTITPIGGDATGENSIHTYNEYSTDGNFLVGATNSRGYSSNTEYNTTTGLVESTTNAAGITTYYDYGANGLLYETSAEVNETTLSVEMDYNNRNQMIFYSNGNTDYNISYTPLGQYKSFTVGDPNNSGYKLIDFLYDAQGRIKTETFGDGGIRYYYYDSLGRLTSTYVKRPGSTVAGFETSYSYDSNNRLIRSYSQSTRYGSSTVAAYYFTYAMDGKVTGVSNGMYSTNYGYDERSNLSFTTINYPMTVQGKTGYRENMVISYQYDEDSNITDANISSPLFGDTSSHNTYDDLGRLEDTKYVLTSGAELSVGYDYAQGSRLDTNGDAIAGGGQTTLVNGAEYYLDNAASPFDGFRYEYDILGNITQIERYNEGLDDHELYASYVYDDLNQLVRENDAANNRTVLYDYDNFGNIQGEKVYTYTTAATPSGTYTENTWEYDDAQWGDLLTEYNGEEIVYDGLGNPTEYLEGITLEWEPGQRKLNNIDTEEHTVYNYYDASGLLNYKTVRNKLTNRQEKTVRYWFDGDRLAYEYRCLTPNNTTRHQYIVYYYDTNNQLYGFGMYDYLVRSVAKIENYYYLRSPNGDIVGIMNEDGDLVVEYAYDAWGNTLSISGSMASTIGEINPFRYKGYYYDQETGFYYLQSRYYDPVTHRFLNADGYANTAQGYGGENMFAYSLNEPVNRKDPSGRVSYSIMIGYTNRGSGQNNNAAKAKTALSKRMAETGLFKNAGNAYRGSYLQEVSQLSTLAPTQTNCYGLALARSENLNPGELSGTDVSMRPYDLEATYAAVEADLKTLGLTARRLDGPTDLIASNEYRVGLRVGTQNLPNKSYGDYHFVVQIASMEWAHKEGTGGDMKPFEGSFNNAIPWDNSGKPYYDSDIIWFAIGG